MIRSCYEKSSLAGTHIAHHTTEAFAKLNISASGTDRGIRSFSETFRGKAVECLYQLMEI